MIIQVAVGVISGAAAGVFGTLKYAKAKAAAVAEAQKLANSAKVAVTSAANDINKTL